MKYFLIAIVALFSLAIGVSVAYADHSLPIERDYVNHECQLWNMITLTEDGIIRFACHHDWTVAKEIFDKIDKITIEKGHNYEEWLKEVIPLIENNPLKETPKDKVGIGDTIIPKVIPDVETENIDEQILDEFEKCFGGLEQAHAVQQEYSFEKFERKYQRFLTGDDKLAEECIANGILRNYTNAAYPLKVVREDTTPKTKIPELKMSKGTQVTDEKKQAVADAIVYPPWYKNPYEEWTGQNRGNSQPLVTENVVNQFTGKTSKQIMEDYKREKAASILTEQDIANLAKELETLVCETAWKTSGYGGIDISKWRIFLAEGECNELLGTVIFRGMEMPFEDVIEAKLKQQEMETKPDLRSQK